MPVIRHRRPEATWSPGTWMLVAGLAKLATPGDGASPGPPSSPAQPAQGRDWLHFVPSCFPAVNIAMYANPIGLIVAGIVLLIRGCGGGHLYYWDDLKKTFSDWGVFQLLGKSIDWLIDKLNMIRVSKTSRPAPCLTSALKPETSAPRWPAIARVAKAVSHQVALVQQLIQASRAAPPRRQPETGQGAAHRRGPQ